MKKTVRGLAAVLLLLLLAACSSDAVGSALSGNREETDVPDKSSLVAENADDREIYSIYLDYGWEMGETERSGWMYMESDGTVIPEGEIKTKLYDMLSGTVAAMTETKTEDTGLDDEYGSPITATYSRLYSPNGELLRDWEEKDYSEGFASFLIRHDNINWYEEIPDGFETALWDIRTGESVIDGVYSLEKVDDSHFLALDERGVLLGMLDENGNKIAGFPLKEKYYYPTVENSVILVDTHDPYYYDGSDKTVYRIIDNDFNTVFETNQLNISYYALRGPYATYKSGEERGVLSLETLRPLYVYENSNDTVTYFDGDIMVIRNADQKAQIWYSVLCDAAGNKLTDKYDSITFDDSDYGSDSRSEYFIASKGDEISLLSRDGSVMSTMVIEGLTGINIYNGYIEYYITENGLSKMGLLDMDFDVIVSARDNDYISVSRISDYSAGKKRDTDVISASRYNSAGQLRTDLFTLDGDTIITGLSAVGTVGKDSIAVLRGFSFGLIDYSGEWIARHSVYHDINLD